MSIIQAGKKVAMCSDHAGYELKNIIQGYLEAQDIEYTDFGCSFKVRKKVELNTL